MEGKPYMSDAGTLMKAGVWSPQKFKCVLLQNRYHLLQRWQFEMDVSRFHSSSSPGNPPIDRT